MKLSKIFFIDMIVVNLEVKLLHTSKRAGAHTHSFFVKKYVRNRIS